MIDTRPPAVALMGPTAVGKSALALEWATRLDAEIISVDSAQVYRSLSIGTAKPGAGERAQVAHHLLDVREPWQVYSASAFAVDARAAIIDITSRGRMPLLVGGSGLYFRTLFRGLSPMPAADPALRRQLAAEANRHGWPALHAELARIDPEAAARIRSTDPQRIQRALEVYRSSGIPLSQWQRLPAMPSPLPVRMLKLVLSPPQRAHLHARIAQRLEGMLSAGLVDEVCALRRLPELVGHPCALDLPALRAVGYRQVWEHLDGQYDFAQCRERILRATCQLAKRQLTWLRAELDVRWFDPISERTGLDHALSGFIEHVGRKNR